MRQDAAAGSIVVRVAVMMVRGEGDRMRLGVDPWSCVARMAVHHHVGPPSCRRYYKRATVSCEGKRVVPCATWDDQG
jgi:hypothetical protein